MAIVRLLLIALVCIALMAALVFFVLLLIGIQEGNAALGVIGATGLILCSGMASLLGRCVRPLKWQIIGSALEKCSQELRHATVDPVTLFNRGISFVGKGDHVRAIACFEESIRLDPVLLPYAHISRANSYGALGLFDRVITMSTEQIRELSNPFAYCVRATAYNGLGRWDRALPDAAEAIRLAPDFFLGYDARGHAYLQRGSFHPLLKVIAIAWMLATFGFLRRDHFDWRTPCGSRDDYRQAVADFTEAIRLHPQAWDCYAGRAKAYRALGDPTRAIADEAAVQTPI